MAADAVPEARTAFLRRLFRAVAIATAVGLFMSYVGAFGSGAAPVGLRTAFFVGIGVMGAALGVSLSTVLERIPFLFARRWLRTIVIGSVVALPVAAAAWAASPLWGLGSPQMVALPYFLGPAFVVSAACTGLSIIMLRGERASAVRDTRSEPPPPSLPAFLEKAPFTLRAAELWAIEAEDHYLRVHTSQGSTLLLVRIGDAVRELHQHDGAQVHRSWWVAREAVRATLILDNGRGVLVLKDGSKVPVSRSRLRDLKAEGWFQPSA